jgi:small-conductance mechanosensitive channel
MKSELLHHDARRACRKHRQRIDALPAHVVAPLAVASGAVGGAALSAHWLGLPLLGVLAVVFVATMLAALAAHRAISSLAAGAGILLAQPYRPGDRVRVYVPALGDTVDAEVVRVGAANTTLLVRGVDGRSHPGCTGAERLILVPNNRMLRSTADPVTGQEKASRLDSS